MMTGDLAQIRVVTKNELIKCVRGKKFLISMIIIVAIFFLITALQFMLNNWDKLSDLGMFADVYLEMFPMVISIIVALLSSIALVSEFEERTALILFTRPIKRTSIIIGKILSCLLIEMMIILIYYVLISIVCVVQVGSFSPDIIVSYFLAVAFAFSASGVAFIVSAFLKKGSVCTVITILLLVIVLPITSAMMGSDGGENWFMMDQAGNSIYTCVPEYVDRYNETAEGFQEVVGNAIEILKGFTDKDIADATVLIDNYIASEDFSKLSPQDQQSMIALDNYLHIGASDNLQAMVKVLEMMVSSSMFSTMEHPDIGRSVIVMMIWGIIGYIIAWAKFVRREF